MQIIFKKKLYNKFSNTSLEPEEAVSTEQPTVV